MIKLATLIVVMLCSYSAFAVNGPYVGIGAGYSNTIFDVNRYRGTTTGPVITHSWQSFYGNADGIQGQVVAGYVYDINKFRLGAEIFALLLKLSCYPYEL